MEKLIPKIEKNSRKESKLTSPNSPQLLADFFNGEIIKSNK